MKRYHHPYSIITLRNALMAGGKCCGFVWFCFCCLVRFKLPCKPLSPLVQKENVLWTMPSNMLGHGQKLMHREFHLQMRMSFSTVQWLGTGTDCPEKLWSVPHWRYPRSVWTQSCAMWSRMTRHGPFQPYPLCDSMKIVYVSDHITTDARKILLNVGILQRLPFIPESQWWHQSFTQL